VKSVTGAQFCQALAALLKQAGMKNSDL